MWDKRKLLLVRYPPKAHVSVPNAEVFRDSDPITMGMVGPQDSNLWAD